MASEYSRVPEVADDDESLDYLAASLVDESEEDVYVPLHLRDGWVQVMSLEAAIIGAVTYLRLEVRVLTRAIRSLQFVALNNITDARRSVIDNGHHQERSIYWYATCSEAVPHLEEEVARIGKMAGEADDELYRHNGRIRRMAIRLKCFIMALDVQWFIERALATASGRYNRLNPHQKKMLFYGASLKDINV